MQSYVNKLGFPEMFLSIPRIIAMNEGELYQVSTLLELVESGGESQTSDTAVRAVIWEACRDSGALLLLGDLLNMRRSFFLENVRFYKEEEKNDPNLANKPASLADLYVNDAFGTGHMAHACTEELPST